MQRSGFLLRWFGERFAIGATILLVLLVLPGCGRNAEPVPTSTPVGATPNSHEDWERMWEETVAAALVEGEVVISGSQEIRRAFEGVFQAFEERFPGIKATVNATSGGQESRRIILEARAGEYNVDILMIGITSTDLLIREGLLDPVADHFILPEVKDESLWWNGRHQYGDQEQQFIFLHNASVRGADLVVNTNLVNPDDIESYWDLTEEPYRSMLVAGFIGEAGQAGSVQEFYGREGLGPEWLEAIVLGTELEMIDSTDIALDWIITGRKGIGIFMGSLDPARRLESEGGAPIKVIERPLKEGGVLSGGGGASMMAALKNAANPNAQKVFINWYLSREGQMAINEHYAFRQSLREDLPAENVAKVREEGRRESGANYIYPQGDPAFQALRDEALAFTQDLIERWRAERQ